MTEKFRGVIHAKPGAVFFGISKKLRSCWFDTREEAESWIYAMSDGLTEKIESADILVRGKC